MARVAVELFGGNGKVEVNRPAQLLMRVPVPWVFVLAYLAGAVLERMRPLASRPDMAVITTIAGALLLRWAP